MREEKSLATAARAVQCLPTGLKPDLPETRLLELLHIELDVLLGDNPAQAGIFWGPHKKPSCKKPHVGARFVS